MCKKLIRLIPFVVALGLASSNAALGALTVEVRVSAGSDDAEQAVNPGNQDTYNTSSDLELVDDNSDNGGRQFVGMNFRNVQVPLGAQIRRAYIEFACDASKFNSDPAYLLIWGHLALNPDGFGGTLTPTTISDRPRTEAQVPWEPEPWTTGGQISQTSNISSIINELISQDGWAPGNAIELIIGEDTSKGPFTGFRDAESFNGIAALAPLLVIELSTKLASTPVPADGAMNEGTWVTLSWQPGETAVTHDMYMSDNFDDVNDGAESAFQGNYGSPLVTAGFAGLPFSDGLVPGTTYYWRVDEVEADGTTTHVGPVWSFWVPSVTAYDPSPSDGTQFVGTDVTLSWTAGFGAKLHAVHFGDDLDVVSNAGGGPPLTNTTFAPGTLEMGKTYYWRVDELDPPTTIRGNVWSFSTVPIVPITDPGLIGWWTFDEGIGNVAVDWSGHGNHGTIAGDPEWTDGIMKGALDLTSDHVAIDGVVDDITSTDISLSIWINSIQTGQGDLIAANESGSGHPLEFYIEGGQPGRYDGDDVTYTNAPVVADGRWHMLTYVRQGDSASVYVDGVQVASGPASFDLATVTRWSIGQEWDDSTPSNFYVGMVDDVRFYDKALTADEIAVVMRGDTKLAGSPVPSPSTTVDIRDISSLSWSAGDTAASHDVYFGTDRDAVALADNASPEFQGNQTGTSLSLASLVEFGGGDYYWRIDEVEADGTANAGTIWKFTVPDYLIVEDFESYNDLAEDDPASNRIYLTWIDGFGTTTNGAVAGNLDVPLMAPGRDSAQAMPVSYDNAGRTSEVTKTLTSGKDWTEQGVTKLVVWFSGDAANTAERMFVALGNAVVYHSDDAATQTAGWNEWVIDLQEFANQGANVGNVGSITLGFGTRNAPAAGGGIGTVEFDDIGLAL